MPLEHLFDLDGTLSTDAGPVPGAVEKLNHLKRRKAASPTLRGARVRRSWSGSGTMAST
jgi:hypothetical protein